MKNKVIIRTEIDPSCQIPEVIIRAKEKTAAVDQIIAAIERHAERERHKITAYQGSVMRLVSQRDIIRVYTETRKLIVCTHTGDYEVRCPLRELEEILDEDWFMRISRFEIVNLNMVSGFDFNLSGTIRVTFTDGSSTWVARRYVQSIKHRLTQQ